MKFPRSTLLGLAIALAFAGEPTFAAAANDAPPTDKASNALYWEGQTALKQSDWNTALERFVASALAMGLKRALVITGKGQGILRAAVPRWLATPPLNGLVTATGRAAVRHGGEGAFYLLIRRPERQGGAKRRP